MESSSMGAVVCFAAALYSGDTAITYLHDYAKHSEIYSNAENISQETGQSVAEIRWDSMEKRILDLSASGLGALCTGVMVTGGIILATRKDRN